MGKEQSPQRMLGAVIRAQRELAALPMRQLAATVGISNPYLSQIERGLRAPSEAVLQAIATSLETSADHLYADAGFVPRSTDAGEDEPPRLEVEIRAALELTASQRRALIEIYRAFVDANGVRRTATRHQRGSALEEPPSTPTG